MSEVDVSPAALLRMVQEKRVLLLTDPTAVLDKTQLALMRDITKTSVDQLRVMVESEGVKAEQELAAIMTKLVSGMGQNPFMEEGGTRREPVTLEGESLPSIELVEGELSTEPLDMNFKSLMSDSTKP